MADDQADDKWSVRGVPKALRDAAVAAARRRDTPVGEWLSGAIDRALQAEREPIDLVVSRPSDALPDVSPALSDAASDLALIERAIDAAVTLAKAPEVPTAFRRRANRLLRESLPTPLSGNRGQRLIPSSDKSGDMSGIASDAGRDMAEAAD